MGLVGSRCGVGKVEEGRDGGGGEEEEQGKCVRDEVRATKARQKRAGSKAKPTSQPAVVPSQVHCPLSAASGYC
jgi:hypothetical protein